MSKSTTPPTHSADTVLLRVASNTLETLLWQRRDEPHALRFALPGGLLERGESLEEAALRHLAAKVGAGPVATSSSSRRARSPSEIHAAG